MRPRSAFELLPHIPPPHHRRGGGASCVSAGTLVRQTLLRPPTPWSRVCVVSSAHPSLNLCYLHRLPVPSCRPVHPRATTGSDQRLLPLSLSEGG
ncbi:MAG: hypothetical protein WHS45_12735 [Anaerolinea sp.]